MKRQNPSINISQGLRLDRAGADVLLCRFGTNAIEEERHVSPSTLHNHHYLTDQRNGCRLSPYFPSQLPPRARYTGLVRQGELDSDHPHVRHGWTDVHFIDCSCDGRKHRYWIRDRQAAAVEERESISCCSFGGQGRCRYQETGRRDEEVGDISSAGPGRPVECAEGRRIVPCTRGEARYPV